MKTVKDWINGMGQSIVLWPAPEHHDFGQSIPTQNIWETLAADWHRVDQDLRNAAIIVAREEGLGHLLQSENGEGPTC